MILGFPCWAQSGENESAADENDSRGEDSQDGRDMQCRALEVVLLWVGEVLLCHAQSGDGRNASVERCNDDGMQVSRDVLCGGLL